MASEIQYLSTSKWTYSKEILVSCKTVWLRAIKNWAQFKEKDFFLEMNEIEKSLLKVNLLSQHYSKTNSH